MKDFVKYTKRIEEKLMQSKLDDDDLIDYETLKKYWKDYTRGINNKSLAMNIQIENLKAKITGKELNIYQKADALIEFNKLLDYVDKIEQQLKLCEVTRSLPTDEQLTSDKDEICFRGAINQSHLDTRQILERGFVLGYDYLKMKLGR